MGRRKHDNPINENWIKGSTLKHYKENAKQVLERAKEAEEKMNCRYEKVSDKPLTFKRVFL